MIKISKITDYGLVLLTHLVQGKRDHIWTAKDLSKVTKIPLPTVGKILKLLSKGEILDSTRGSQGGYRLAKDPGALSLANVIDVLEGRFAVTDCGDGGKIDCNIQHLCPTKANWQKINHLIYGALGNLTLKDMARPLQGPGFSQRGK